MLESFYHYFGLLISKYRFFSTMVLFCQLLLFLGRSRHFFDWRCKYSVNLTVNWIFLKKKKRKEENKRCIEQFWKKLRITFRLVWKKRSILVEHYLLFLSDKTRLPKLDIGDHNSQVVGIGACWRRDWFDFCDLISI